MDVLKDQVKLCDDYWVESMGLFIFSGIILALGITLFS